MRKLICFFGKIFYSLFPKKKLDPSAVKKILVFKIGALGDILMATPFLRATRKRFPNAKITYLVGSFCEPMLDDNKGVDKLESFDHNIFYKKDLAGILKLIKRIRRENYDVIFILDKHYLVNFFLSMTRIPVRIGFNRYGEGFANTINVEYNKVMHEIEYYLELAYAAGAKKLSSDEKHLDIYLSKKDTEFAKHFIKKNRLNQNKLVCIAPGGAINPGQRMDTRRWPVEKSKGLADKLIHAGYSVLLIGGPTDKEFAQGFNKKVISAVGKTTLKQSIALIKLCRVAVVSDSGPMHFASAVGTPTISLFGITDPRRKAPLSTKKVKHVYIWKKPAVQGWNDDGVFRDFNKITTISKITVDEVFAAVKKMMKGI